MSTITKIINKKIAGSRNRATLLDCFYQSDGDKKPVIIFCHGFKGFKDWGCFNLMAEKFAEEGFVFIKFNFSYNGGTLEEPIDFPDLDAFSKNNFSTELDDLGMVIDMVLQEEILPLSELDVDKIQLIGHSRGGGIVVLKMAEDSRISRGITLASVSDFGYFFNQDPQQLAYFRENGVVYIENSRTHQQMPIKYQLYEDYERNQPRLDILNNAINVNQEVLVVHGTKDSSVNINNAYALHKNLPHSQLLIIEDADHVFGGYQPFEKTDLPDHFQEWLNQAIDFLK